MNHRYAIGDHVTLACEDDTAAGQVTAASSNGRWLIVRISDWFIRHVGAVPLELQQDGSYRSIATGAVLRVSPRRFGDADQGC